MDLSGQGAITKLTLFLFTEFVSLFTFFGLIYLHGGFKYFVRREMVRVLEEKAKKKKTSKKTKQKKTAQAIFFFWYSEMHEGNC